MDHNEALLMALAGGDNGGGGGGGSSYVLPVATENKLGGIKVGNNLNIEPDGTLNANGCDFEFVTAQEAETWFQ